MLVRRDQAKKSSASSSGVDPLASTKGRDPAAITVDKKDDGSSSGGGRPSKEAYDAEQNALKAQIEVLQAKQNEVRNKIAAVSGKGPHQERKVALRAELDSLRADQARLKGGRGKTLDQVKLMQDNVAKKIKDLQAAKAKAPFKSGAEVDAKIKTLERQVESGQMKLVDEKKALAEISNLKKTRKTVESFSDQQAEIDAEKAKIDAIRAELDNPEAKAVSDKFNAARAELDKINKQHDEASKGRDALFDERNAVSKELDALFAKKKESVAAFRAANDKYYQKLNDDRAKRLERQRTERQAYEDSKRDEVNQRLLEEAQAPAFEREIEDCRNLIVSFKKRIGQAGPDDAGSSSLFERASIARVPALELRKVEADAPKGTVVAKKKGQDEEESWGGFAGKKKKGGNKKAAPAPAATAAEPEEDSAAAGKDEKLNLPFGTLSALMSLGITAPLTTSEIQKTINDLEIKKKYLVENQDRVTAERVASAKKKIADAESKSKMASAPQSNGTSDSTAAAAETKDQAATENAGVVNGDAAAVENDQSTADAEEDKTA